MLVNIVDIEELLGGRRRRRFRAKSGLGSADWWRTDCGLRIEDYGWWSGTLHRGLMGVGRGFLGQEDNHRLQVNGEVV